MCQRCAKGRKVVREMDAQIKHVYCVGTRQQHTPSTGLYAVHNAQGSHQRHLTSLYTPLYASLRGYYADLVDRTHHDFGIVGTQHNATLRMPDGKGV